MKEDGFARAMGGLADTFKKPSSQAEKPKRHPDEDEEEERRRKRLKREESKSSERYFPKCLSPITEHTNSGMVSAAMVADLHLFPTFPHITRGGTPSYLISVR